MRRRRAHLPTRRRRSRSGWAQGLRGDEAANGPLIEASAIAVFLMLALAMFGPAMGPPPPANASFPNANSRAILERTADDLLKAIATTPDPEYGMLHQRFLAEAVNGDTAKLEKMLGNRHVLPPGSGYMLAVKQHDHGLVVLHETPAKPPERAEANRMMHWNVDNAFLVPEFQYYDGDTAMQLTLIPIRDAAPVEAQRDLLVEAEATDKNGVVYRVAAPIVIKENGPQVTIGVVEGGVVDNYYERTDIDEFTIRLTESGDAGIPSGTNLTIHLPPWWTNIKNESVGAGWATVGNLTTYDGVTIYAALEESLSSASIDFTFQAERPNSHQDNAHAFDLAWAQLDGGRKGYAPIVFKGNGETDTIAGLAAKQLHLAIPRLASAGGVSEWSVVIQNPDSQPSAYDPVSQACILNCLDLQDLTLRQPDGRPLFLTAPPGWVLIENGSALRYTSTINLGRDQAQELRVPVTLNGTVVGGMPYTLEPQVRFPETDLESALLRVPFRNAHEVRLPSTSQYISGYPFTPDNATHSVCSALLLDKRKHEGCATYQTSKASSLVGLQEELARGSAASTLALPAGEHFKPGGSVVVEADFSPLEQELLGHPEFHSAINTTITLYHPWVALNTSREDWTVWKQVSSPDPKFTATIDLDPERAIYGTYVVVAERNLDFDGGGTPDQTVRKATWITVGKTGTLQAAYLHTLILQVWMQDWQ